MCMVIPTVSKMSVSIGRDRHMKLCRLVLFIAFFSLLGCSLDGDDAPELSLVSADFDFNDGIQGWTAGFADYPANSDDSAAFELKFKYTEGVNSKLGRRSLMLSGKNINRDLFMYIKRKVENLQPNTDYTITFNVELASDLQSVQISSGGSVFLKAGATSREPKSVIDDGKYVLNIDKGDEDFAGEDMVTLGDLFANATGSNYTLITRSNTISQTRYVARTNANGELWLIIGADSTVEGTTKIFFTRIKVLLSVS